MTSLWTAFALSLKLAAMTTVVLFILALPISYCLHYYNFKGKSLLKALITLPLVLPPTVLGYYILLMLKDGSPIGTLWQNLFNEELAFTFTGILLGSVIYSLPFMINPIYAGLENLPRDIEESSFTLGRSKWQTYRLVLMPNIIPSIFTAIAMTFAHTMGEFGVILMIGGSIYGETKVASIAIYEELEALNFEVADNYAILLSGFSFMMLLIVYNVKKRIGI